MKNGLNDLDNHYGVVTHLESGILECKVKQTLGRCTTDKANGGDGIQAELFQILKMMLLKVLYYMCQQIGKLSSDHRSRKGQFSFKFQRRAVPKNVQTVMCVCVLAPLSVEFSRQE